MVSKILFWLSLVWIILSTFWYGYVVTQGGAYQLDFVGNFIVLLFLLLTFRKQLS